MHRPTYVLTVLVACGCADRELNIRSTPTADYVKGVLTDDLCGIPLEEFERRVGIEEPIYDEIYTNEPEHSRRLYHFDGFCIDLSVEHRGKELYTDSHFFPGVDEDGLTRQQRMSEYEAALSQHFAERQKRLDSIRENSANSDRGDPFGEEF